jgi:hypothetical protein
VLRKGPDAGECYNYSIFMVLGANILFMPVSTEPFFLFTGRYSQVFSSEFNSQKVNAIHGICNS